MANFIDLYQIFNECYINASSIFENVKNKNYFEYT